tara:strand:+ start:187112 stop:188617 length:1506 start_codon:yes stop_codon:yes gene_type:complete
MKPHVLVRFVSQTRWQSAGLILGTLLVASASAEPNRNDVVDVLHRSVAFFREHASAGGGYVFQISADLSKREGEGRVGQSTAWIEPPATPSVGMAYLQAYRHCHDPLLLDAAQETAFALVRGQLRSGGWDVRIEFEPKHRKAYSYRVDPDEGKKRRNTTTFDDDKSQSAMRFLMQLDQELKFQNAAIHECVTYALNAAADAQYACGAWPQRYTDSPDAKEQSAKDAAKDSNFQRASFPDTWSRTFAGDDYTDHYTLNDNTIADLITTMLDGWDVYGDRRYLESAIRGGDFLLRAQLPEPQPAWAQQYNHEMHPVWARKFEPPAISGGESQGVMKTLINLYRRTASETDNAERFLEPVPRAIAYLRRSQRHDGRLARFYELETNQPLYFTRKYQLVYTDDDLPTHYGFIVSSNLDSIERLFLKTQKTPVAELHRAKSDSAPKRSKQLDAEVSRIVNDLDRRGAWVESGKLRYHGDDDPTSHVIRSDTFSKNLKTLAEWLAAP